MGTQTSKPLFGDEERRNRFRRPRTPVNNNSSNTNITAPGDLRTWPCSNCHATVSNDETRCPYCGGIQVKVRIPRSPMSATKAINSNLLLERLSTPTTPVARKHMDANRIQGFVSESATTSTMDYDDDEEEDDEDVEAHIRPPSALSQASSLSQNFNFPHHHRLPSPPFGGRQSPVPFADRPPNPVALTLEAVQVSSSSSPAPDETATLPPPAAAAALSKRKAASGFEVPKKKMVLPPPSSSSPSMFG